MKSNMITSRIRSLFGNLKKKLSPQPSNVTKHSVEKPQKKPRSSLEKPHSIADRLIGKKTKRILPLFKGLDRNLYKSGVKISFQAYVSLTLFVALIASIIMLPLVTLPLFFALGIPFPPAFLFGLGACLLAPTISIIGFYSYPIYRADKLKRDLEDELPFTTGYMAILTSAGVSPEKVFYSLSSISVPLAASAEAKDIVRNVNLFGQDIISALEETSKRTPSDRFREMLEGFISTVHSGGDSTAYLREKSKQYMKLKKISLRKFSDTLSVLSEFYVAILLTGPLLIVIMLSVMSMLGGGDLGMLSPDLLLNLLTYVGLPLGAIIFLIVLDAVTPKW